MFLDIDNFKNINDKLGHQKGDVVLKRIATILNENIRQTDLIARWGGEEFIIALIDSSLEDSKIICEKLRKSIEEDLELTNLCSYNVTASFGLTMVNSTDTKENLLLRVDNAMYKSKNEGKNRITVVS